MLRVTTTEAGQQALLGGMLKPLQLRLLAICLQERDALSIVQEVQSERTRAFLQPRVIMTEVGVLASKGLVAQHGT
jgi:hypothetical protein